MADNAKLNLLLADDDLDDCEFFIDALNDLPVKTTLTTVHNGVELMQLLSQKVNELPDALFLDLNMPLKNGFDCLAEIKANQALKSLPVIIFSTSFNTEVVDLLHHRGANFYIRKPAEFSRLKKVIHEALNIITKRGSNSTTRETFVIHA